MLERWMIDLFNDLDETAGIPPFVAKGVMSGTGVVGAASRTAWRIASTNAGEIRAPFPCDRTK